MEHKHTDLEHKHTDLEICPLLFLRVDSETSGGSSVDGKTMLKVYNHMIWSYSEWLSEKLIPTGESWRSCVLGERMIKCQRAHLMVLTVTHLTHLQSRLSTLTHSAW